MINNFKQFENTSDRYFSIIDMERGNIQSVQIHESEQSASNWIINFVHENFKDDGVYDEVEDVFDPYELLELFNERCSPDYEILLFESSLEPSTKLDKQLELRKTSNKYNL